MRCLCHDLGIRDDDHNQVDDVILSGQEYRTVFKDQVEMQ